ncbi:MAG: rRNA maturation RNase YbeY [Dehalococcoidia bacterium]|nr:rRNA maturation RNase YbeY [Dehalococcoidia bacterium]
MKLVINVKVALLQKRNTAVFIDPEITIVDKLMTEDWLCHITHAALTSLEVTQNKSIEIAITDDEKMTDLNLRHLGIDSTTDVLSFSNTNSLNKNKNFVSSEESGIMPEFIGEVVISSPQAEQQATEKGISFMEEVAFLLAHGILHLLGRDHETEDERIEMESLHRQTLFAMLGKSSIPIEVNYLA